VGFETPSEQEETSFRLPETFWNKSKACCRRFQNSPAAQTVGIAYLALHLDLLTKKFPNCCSKRFHPLAGARGWLSLMHFTRPPENSDLSRPCLRDISSCKR